MSTINDVSMHAPNTWVGRSKSRKKKKRDMGLPNRIKVDVHE
jgi:hypothetical protein